MMHLPVQESHDTPKAIKVHAKTHAPAIKESLAAPLLRLNGMWTYVQGSSIAVQNEHDQGTEAMLVTETSLEGVD